jgi:hypothetical protein
MGTSVPFFIKADMTIKVIKLVTGEEVVGDITTNGDYVTIDKPCAVMLVASKSTPDQHSMALIPYAAYTNDHRIEVKAAAIIWEGELQEDVYNQYNMLYGSGIQIMTGRSPNTSQLNIVGN